MQISSLAKAMRLVDILNEHPKGLSVSELGSLAGYPNSTVHHMLSTLKESGFLAQNPESKKYSLSFKFLTISRRILDNLDIRKIAHESLQRLNAATGEAVFLSMLRNDRVVFLEKIQTNENKIMLATDVGYTSEPHASASGKVMLSALSREEVLAIYPEERLNIFTPRTITTRQELLAHLDTVREQGYAIDDEEYYRGIRCVAAPIRVSGKTMASVSITGSVFSMTFDAITHDLLPKLRHTSEYVSSLFT